MQPYSNLCIYKVKACTKEENGVTSNSEFETQNACTAEEPMELDWMQDLKAELNCNGSSCEVSILKSEYEGETVFIFL